ncbi:hypothetical protein LIER_11250 [Lithospermum erythrorhizon]|uniref:Uncharacterized protein n=1 Tax=Lithospermum erythrorhizon TaxID=34254 RepID=A0AAV3PRQ1_LITER
MNLRSKFQTFAKGNLTITEFLQQIHSLYCSLRAVGEPLVDSGLIALIPSAADIDKNKLYQNNYTAS